MTKNFLRIMPTCHNDAFTICFQPCQSALTLYLLLLFADNLCKQFDPDQARQSVEPDLDGFPERIFSNMFISVDSANLCLLGNLACFLLYIDFFFFQNQHF